MKTKIKTPIGYLCLPNERITDNVVALYNETNLRKDIDIITVMADDTRKVYRTANPFGVGYTDHYNRVLSSQNIVMKLTEGNPSREIDFLEIS